MRAGRRGTGRKQHTCVEAQGGVLRFFEGEQERAAALAILGDAQCKGGDGRMAAYRRRELSREAEDGKGARGRVEVGEGYGKGVAQARRWGNIWAEGGQGRSRGAQWRPRRWYSTGASGR